MSDMRLRVEIESLIKESGYPRSKNLLCPITKIVSMRHKDLSQEQIVKVASSIL